MKKIMSMPLDVTDMVLNSKVEYLTEITNGLGEHIKQAHIPSSDELEQRPSEDFALVLQHPHLGEFRKLATYDKLLTELNSRIFLDKMNELPKEVVKVAAYFLYKAAKHYKLPIAEDLMNINKSTYAPTSNVVKIAEINEFDYVEKVVKYSKPGCRKEYALPSQKKYPLHDASLVKVAISYFEEYFSKFPTTQRVEYSENVQKAADKYGVSLDNSKIASYMNLDKNAINPDLKTHIKVRQSYVNDENKLVYEELLEKSAELGAKKTASILEKIDKKLNLDRLWNNGIQEPLLSVHPEIYEESIKVGNRRVTQKDLSKLASHPDASKFLDNKTLSLLSGHEGLDIFESLPTPIKNNLEKLL